MRKRILNGTLFLLLSFNGFAQANETSFSKNPKDAKFYTEDIINSGKFLMIHIRILQHQLSRNVI
jgi:hypothetical protein